ncbi:MAG: murein biosynthesis integral membrane protein MurJ [Clostridia bacterium]|nr:murein biosynthesis integral membrane protein MurJ [Clostridia bacterium]MDD4047319.1 murein biosynthesis integral membrane protein MurJ [Clostridia bacterium]
MGRSIAQVTVVIMMMNLASRLFGFIRETVIANVFGATHLTDAYLVAYTIPYFLQAVLGMALVTSIIPVVTKYIVKGEEKEAWRISSITLNWTALFMLVITFVGMIGAKILVKITAPGFDVQTTNLAVLLTVIMFPSVIFMGIGMLITGILNAKKHFAVAAFAPGFSSVIIIVAVLFMGKYGVNYLAWGTLLGMVGTMAIQLPVLKKIGFSYSWDWNFKHPEVKGIFINLMPIFLGTAVNQLYLAINRYFASGLAEGSISALNYAGKLMNLPMGIFVLAVSSAVFPTMSEQAFRGNRDALGRTLSRGLKMVLLITLPAAAGLMVLDEPIVKLLFERGAFDATATTMTADALFYFCIGMFAMSANMVITRAYYALRDVKTPLYLGLISIVVNILISIVLTPYMGHSGLALANTLAAAFNTIVMFVLLKKHLPNLYLKSLICSVSKSILSAIFTAVSALGLYRYLDSSVFVASDTKILLVKVSLSVMLGIFAYGVAIVLLKEEETQILIKNVLVKIKGKKTVDGK